MNHSLLKRILVPVDFSEPALKAVDQARRLQVMTQAAVTLLHVMQRPFDGLRIHTGALQEEAQSAATAQLQALADSHFPGTPVATLVKEGQPAREICEAAQVLSADLIVIGTQGISAVEHFTLGSVVENVVRHAPCGVWVVR
jgi:nucleotide-binding universal stress UspA family protein